MRKYAVVLLVLLSFCLLGCGKKGQSLESMQEPMSIDTISTMSSEAPTLESVAAPVAPIASVAVVNPSTTSVAAKAKLAPLPPQGPYKPSVKEIQSALKNAGFYNGQVDGKMGPMTKKAVEDFQKAKALQADGKVGTKTWGLLSAYLNAAPLTSKEQKR